MNLNEPFVITLSREAGSGGHTVGAILARKLNTRYYDKLLLETLEKQFNLTASEVEKLKGERENWLAHLIKKVSPIPTASALGLDPRYALEFRSDVTTDDIFKAETEILLGFAGMGSCVVAGRLGFFVFKDHPNKLNVFITASKPNRVSRIMARQGLSEESASVLIDSLDRSRENYIHRYAGVSRYDSRNYDIILNSDGHTEEQLADIIIDYIGKDKG